MPRTLSLLVAALFVGQGWADPVIPQDSEMGRARGSLQRLLLSPLTGDTPVQKAGWRLSSLTAGPAPAAVKPRVGRTALRLAGRAEIAGAKGDFAVSSAVPGRCQALGLWVHLGADANVARVGLQVEDSEGEVLLATTPATWSGWRWVEFAPPAFQPAYPQRDKNGKADQPLRAVHVVWFARQADPTEVTVNGLAAASEVAPKNDRLTAELAGGDWAEPGTPPGALLVLTNPAAIPAAAVVDFSVQQDPALCPAEPPDPIHGSDHALGARSWTVVEGKTIEEGSLTDGQDWTAATTPWKTDHYTEAFQFVDLGRPRRVTHLAYRSGDANWVWKVDVAASTDGKTYRPVPGLQGVDLHQKWGRRPLPPAEPFTARYLRLRYHHDGRKTSVIRMPATLSVYDGVADETFEVPTTGRAVARANHRVEVPPRSFAVLDVGGRTSLAPGAYFLAAKVRAGGRTQLLFRHHFVFPGPLAVSAASRFGLNVSEPSLARLHRRLGVGWVRFENLKWPMVSPKPGEYRYDGSVAPWHVDHDALLKDYTAEGLSVLPFLFQTAPYASSAGPAVPPSGGGPTRPGTTGCSPSSASRRPPATAIPATRPGCSARPTASPGWAGCPSTRCGTSRT